MNDYGQLLKDRLAESLDPEMQERYKKRRSDALARQEANYQGPEAVEALGDGARLRALQIGLTKAANKFGSVAGDGGPKSDLPETLDAMQQADTDVFKRKDVAYRQALEEEDAAMGAQTALGDRQMRIAGLADQAERTGLERSRADVEYQSQQAAREEENKPDSAVSRSYQELASAMMPGGDFSTVPASRLKQLMPNLEGLYRVREQSEAKKEAARRHQEAMALAAASRQQMLNLSAAARQDAKEVKEEIRTEKNVENFGKDLAANQEVANDIAALEKNLGFKLEAYDPETGKAGQESVDLPGVSVPLFGRVTAHSHDARMLQSKIASIFNKTLKDRSGAAVTNQEMERLRQEFGAGNFNTEAELLGALKDYKQASAEAMRNAEARYKPDVREKYRQQGGRTSEDLYEPREQSGSSWRDF